MQFTLSQFKDPYFRAGGEGAFSVMLISVTCWAGCKWPFYCGHTAAGMPSACRRVAAAQWGKSKHSLHQEQQRGPFSRVCFTFPSVWQQHMCSGSSETCLEGKKCGSVCDNWFLTLNNNHKNVCPPKKNSLRGEKSG